MTRFRKGSIESLILQHSVNPLTSEKYTLYSYFIFYFQSNWMTRNPWLLISVEPSDRGRLGKNEKIMFLTIISLLFVNCKWKSLLFRTDLYSQQGRPLCIWDLFFASKSRKYNLNLCLNHLRKTLLQFYTIFFFCTFFSL